MRAETITTRQWQSYSVVMDTKNSGINCLATDNGNARELWSIATIAHSKMLSI